MKKFNLLKYILPATLSAVMIGSYSNVDGLFIGNALGDDGLAAVNIAWPIVVFITSVGAGLGIGGSIAVNRTRGNGDTAAERKKLNALLLLVAAGILTTALCSALYIPVLKFLGATGEVFEYAENYSLVISLGAAFQVVGIGLIMLFRADLFGGRADRSRSVRRAYREKIRALRRVGRLRGGSGNSRGAVARHVLQKG